MYRPEQLRFHLARARENGVTEDELIEAITNLASYAGWPNAVTAISVAKDVFQRTPNSEEHPEEAATYWSDSPRIALAV
jgi:alkylhydroperoxidase/carboxymuconolactone decarboxylase family protein YurZ